MPRKKLRTNEDLVRDLMNYSPRGALGQVFIIECIQKWSAIVAKADPATLDSPMFDGKAWVEVAKDVQQRCEAFYGRKPADDGGAA